MVSTPSIYFALDPACRAGHRVLEFDEQWKDDPGYTFYDFNLPEQLPAELLHSFDMVVIDPPYITQEVTTVALLRGMILVAGMGEVCPDSTVAAQTRRSGATCGKATLLDCA